MRSSTMTNQETDTRVGKYLTFFLGKEEFGIPVLKVREIIGTQEMAAVPHVPHYMKGVINLRGRIIPVVDLRLKFGMDEAQYTQRTCTIVVQVQGEYEPATVGIIVDEVSEVANLSADDIEDTPDFGESIDVPYVLGMAKSKGKVSILLDLDRVLVNQDVRAMDSLMRAPQSESSEPGM